MSRRMEGDDEPLTLSRASDRLGWKGSPDARAKRLMRVLEAKERLKGIEIIVRGIGPNGGPTYRVTMRVLRRHCREFFVRGADEVAKDFKAYLERIDERIDDRIDVMVTPQLEELRAVDEELFIQLKELAKRVPRVS